MAFVAISRAARGALSMRLRRVLRVLAENVDLRTEAQTVAGDEPPVWLDPDGNEWSIYHDPRITVCDVAFAAAATKPANLAKLPDPDETVDGVVCSKDRARIRAEAWSAITHTVPPTVPEGADPFTVAAGNSSVIKAFSGPPAGWHPKEVVDA